MPNRELPQMIKSSFNLPVSELELLKTEAARRAVSVTQVLREAMADHQFLTDEIAKGNQLLIRDANGEIREVVLHR